MKRIAIVGAGRLAWSLIPNLMRAGCEIQQLSSRDADKLSRFGQAYRLPLISTSYQLNPTVDAVFLCVSDSEIVRVGRQFQDFKGVVLHASGSVSLRELSEFAPNAAVVYPLQIFTLDKVTDLSHSPIFYEGNNDFSTDFARNLAEGLSSAAKQADSAARLRIHLGAVFACNFSNYLYRIAADLLPAGCDFRVYEALIREQVEKAFLFSPAASQTGPAIRGDRPVLQKHLTLLAENTDLQRIYREFSLLINPNLDL